MTEQLSKLARRQTRLTMAIIMAYAVGLAIAVAATVAGLSVNESAIAGILVGLPVLLFVQYINFPLARPSIAVQPLNTTIIAQGSVSAGTTDKIRIVAGVPAIVALRKGETSRHQIDLSGADLQGEDLTGAELAGAYLHNADLRGASLRGAKLMAADLVVADLRGADLSGADLTMAHLMGAKLNRARLSEADLTWTNLGAADLTDADLSRANLRGANFTKAKLVRANLNSAVLYETVLGDADLSNARGLESVENWGPSIVDWRTLLKSGKLPEKFLRGCGLSDQFVEYWASPDEAAIQFYSCFISYSSADQAFAERLHADLQDRGVRCWFAPEDLKIGETFRGRIDESIRLHDKLLLILSRDSVRSPWVEAEVEAGLERERKQKRTVLIPIRLDDAAMRTRQAWAADIRRTRHIGDFQRWKEHDAYQVAFERLLRDLKAGEKQRAT